MKYLVVILFSSILAFGIGMAGGSQVASADAPVCVYVPEAGHNIHGAFLQFYQTHGGYQNFGLPLTEAFWEQNVLVQYFTNARFELHPDNPEPYRVLLGLLGTEYGIMDPPMQTRAIPPSSNPSFRYFSETGQVVSFAIKEYFDAHGNVDVFGYPLSGLRFESGKFVQYLQRARLEWDPADSGPNKVRPSPVGQIALDKKYAPNFQWRVKTVTDWCPDYSARDLAINYPATARPIVIPSAASPTSGLGVRVRLKFQQTGLTGPQYVDVTVEDQNGKPVSGAAGYATIHFANGDRSFPILPTNSSGQARFNFEIGNHPVNSTTTVEVFVFMGSITGKAHESFIRH